MKIDEIASKEIENFAAKILEKLNISQLEKENIRREFSSHVYESAREIAQKRNSDVVEIKDVESAKDDMESIEEISSSLAKSYADSLKRVGFKERFIAYVIDIFVFGLIVGAFIFSYTLISGQSMSVENVFDLVPPPLPQPFLGSAPLDAMNLKFEVRGLVAGMGLMFTLMFILLEGTFGTTIGKKLVGLRVLDEDGTKIGYKKAVIRNIPKLWPPVITIDALLMIILFRKENQRGFDRIGNTIVVKTLGLTQDKHEFLDF